MHWLTGRGFLFWKITKSDDLVHVEASELLDLLPCDLVVARERPVLAREKNGRP